MKLPCERCGKQQENAPMVVNEGISHTFCQRCHAILQTFPDIGIGLNYFKSDWPVSKNIVEARGKRIDGSSPWKSLK